MRRSAKSAGFLIVTSLVVALLVWTIAGDRRTRPYRVRRSDLSGWTLVTSHADEPWVVALRPPPQLAERLRDQIVEKGGASLVAVMNAALPLVLRSEYDDTLQGEFGIEAIMQIAEGDGVAQASFRPTCIGFRSRTVGDRSSAFLFLAFDSTAFWQLRGNLIPEHQEIAGNGVYDPAALSPILPLAASGAEVEHWLPLRVDPLADCQAQLVVE